MLLSTLKVSSNGNMISVRSFTFLQDFFFSFFINILFQVLLLYFILRVGIAIIFANFYLCQIYFLFFKFFFFFNLPQSRHCFQFSLRFIIYLRWKVSVMRNDILEEDTFATTIKSNDSQTTLCFHCNGSNKKKPYFYTIQIAPRLSN